MAYQLEDFGAG